jgi:hypothetical protein
MCAHRTALDAALALSAVGIPSFPVRADKAPACASGFKAGTRDANELRELWHRCHAPLVGVPTGSASVLDAVDIDPRHGGDGWLERNRQRLPPTRTHTTRSGGLHLLFKHEPGIRNSAGKIASGVDVRGDGGFIVWWPAVGLPVAVDGPLAPWPAWLLRELLPPRGAVTPAHLVLPAERDAARHYAVRALRRAVERVASAPEGARNETLNAETYSLARFISTGVLTPGEVADPLAIAAYHAGLTQTETAKTLASALRAGVGGA